MKKLLFFLAFCLLLTGCTGVVQNDPATDPDPLASAEDEPDISADEPPADPDKPALAGLSMTLKSVDTADGLRVTVEWHNDTGKRDLTFGEAFTLYQKTDDGWEALPIKENWAFRSIGYLFEDTREHTYNLGAYLDEPTPDARYYLEATAIEEYPTVYYFGTAFSLD